jgi:hypothetical protein
MRRNLFRKSSENTKRVTQEGAACLLKRLVQEVDFQVVEDGVSLVEAREWEEYLILLL